MAVNRQLRDEFLAVLLKYLHRETDRATFQADAESLQNRVIAEAPDDPGLDYIVLMVLSWLYDSAYQNTRTSEEYDMMRRYVAFLRSDLDYPPREPAVKTDYQRLMLFLVYTVGAFYITILCARHMGYWGTWIYFVFSIPMWIGRRYVQSSPELAERDTFYPFESQAQYRAHEHLADVPPSLPSLKDWLATPARRRGQASRIEQLNGLVLPLIFFTAITLFMTVTWPQVVFSYWVRVPARQKESAR